MAASNGAHQLAASIGQWATGRGPLYAQLAWAVQQSIDRGDLPAGARLPSERALSAALGLSRTTVVAAYDQLRAAGLVQSHRGSGTRVARRDVGGGAAVITGAGDVGPRPAEDLDEGPFAFTPPADDIELTIGALPGAAMIVEEAERLVHDGLPELIRSFGYLPLGLPALREAVASHMTSLGIPTSAGQVLITSGAQQAIDLLARHLGGPAASVILENPTYPPAVDVFRATGAHLVPVPLDDLGIRPDMIRLNAQRVRAPLVYLNPICQNPSGTTVPEARRQEIARLAAELGLLVIDDLTSAYLMTEGWPPVPIGAYDREDRVITVGSLSKVAWGGLRIGWIRAPRPLIGQLAARKVDVDFSTSLISQALAVRLFPRLDELVPLARAAALERLATLEAALRRRLPSWTWAHPTGGLCLWVRLPAGDAAAFARIAAEHGVIIRPGPQFSADGSNRDRLRLAYGHEPAVLEEAVDRLADAWADFRPVPPRATRVAVTV